jgi:ornithine carbamoyltransferase
MNVYPPAMRSPAAPPVSSGALRSPALRSDIPHVLSVADLDGASITEVVEHALALKALGPGGGRSALLAGRWVALVFDKPSLRTRVSFEVGIQRLGGGTTTLAGSEIGLGSRESLADIARTLSRYVNAIVVRMLSHAGLEELAAAATVPVVNALSEREHPCQALADLLTVREHLGSLRGRRLAYVGDGNNVCHSLLLAGAAVGLEVRVATPPGFGPDPSIVDQAAQLARGTGGRVLIGTDPVAAVRGADAIYTDVWASMGAEHEAADRRRAFAGYRVSAALQAEAPDAIVMHCLPAHRGEEIDAAVIDGPRSVVFDQAENRMHAQQALLVHLLGTRSAIARGHRLGALEPNGAVAGLTRSS